MEKLLNELFSRYQREVFAYLFSLCHDADLSEELTADTFFEAVKSLHRFRGDADEKTWLFSVACHRWYHYLQKHRQPAVPLDEELLPAGPSPEEVVCCRETARRVQELLAREPERTRTIVQLRLLGLSFREIGQKVGVTENSARVIDFRARTRLRETLKKEEHTNG